MAHRRGGFTLIELLVVISILGILAAVAIPQYTSYVDSAKAKEAYLLARPIMKDLAEYYAHTGAFPSTNEEAGYPPPEKMKGKYVSAISIDKGTINVGTTMWGRSTSFRPASQTDNPSGALIWAASSDDAPLPEGYAFIAPPGKEMPTGKASRKKRRKRAGQ